MKTLCIYHKTCPDGSMSAAIVKRHLEGEVVCIPCQYGTSLNDLMEQQWPLGDYKYDRLIMVDFSFPRETMEHLSTRFGDNFLCLDHHKTAEENLRNVPGCVFDPDRSGCGMAWKRFAEGEPPWPVKWIEDWDLWNHHYGETTRRFHDGLTLVDYDDLRFYQDLLKDDKLIRETLRNGDVLSRANEARIKHALKLWRENPQYVHLFGEKIAAINWCDKSTVSTLLHELVKESPSQIAIAYTIYGDSATEMVFSIRSAEEVDSSQIARKLGGGGHAQACGCELESNVLWKTKSDAPDASGVWSRLA